MIFPGGFSRKGSARLIVLSLAGMAALSNVGDELIDSADFAFHLRGVNRRLSPPPDPIYGDVPDCARDVFVALREEGGRGDGRDCRGLLIRDDIVVTSKECSKSSFEFDFAGYGVVRADPHASLNSKDEMADSRLGFLEAHPPYHYHFVDRPVRRTRMFLSRRPETGADGEQSPEAAIVTCGNHLQPIAHNFPSDNGEMVPLAELAGVVPKDILWEDLDLDTAPMLAHGSHRWWTRPITLDDENRTIERMIDEYSGPPGSASLPWAHHEFDRKASALMEAVDPRGHRRDCFVDYFVRWKEETPFSGTHFFDWLDYGYGRLLFENRFKYVIKRYNVPIPPAQKGCEHKYFDPTKVHYFDDEMRGAYEVDFEPSADGTKLIARYKKNGEPVPPSRADDAWTYMWDLNKKWYIVDDRWDKKTYGRVKHSGIVAGKAALSGGKAYVGEDGALWGINFSSGHYRPKIQAAAMMYQWMKDRGFNLTAFHWIGRSSWSTKACLETDWEKIEIPGFAAVELNQACHEVTTSPTWMLKDDV